MAEKKNPFQLFLARNTYICFPSTNSLNTCNSSMFNMAAQPVCVHRETLLNVMQVATVEGNEQL